MDVVPIYVQVIHYRQGNPQLAVGAIVVRANRQTTRPLRQIGVVMKSQSDSEQSSPAASGGAPATRRREKPTRRVGHPAALRTKRIRGGMEPAHFWTIIVFMVFICFVFALALSCELKSTERAVKSDSELDPLMVEWAARDGANVYDTSPRLLEQCIDNPSRFYKAMSADSVGYEAWVHTLGTGCFTNFTDTVTSTLEAYRLQTISAIRHQKVEKRYEWMRVQLLEELESVSIGYVD